MIRLLELRTEKELSQREIAKLLNISQSTYNNWENENTQPSIEQLIALSKLFEVSVDYIIGRNDEYETDKDRLEITGKQRELLKAFNTVSPDIQDAVLRLLQSII